MSTFRSDAPVAAGADDDGSGGASEPLRPSDHIDGDASAGAAARGRGGGSGGGSGGDGPDGSASDGIIQPALGPVGWARWAWRQLTSMRTALVLLLLLAIAAVPGSIVPQRSADPNGVTQYFTDNPDLAPILDAMQLFDVYTSAWFSAIYLLLFISLIGCVIPRTMHHWKALRARPPRTPARLERLADHRAEVIDVEPGADASAEASAAIDVARDQLSRAGYRVERYDARGAFSVSAERGYLRETGNLVFHVALIGVLVAVGVGGGFAYSGQRVVVEGTTFVNALTDYSSFNRGRFVAEDALTPYALTLDEFGVVYQPVGSSSPGQAGDFVARLTTRDAAGEEAPGEVRVNHPLEIGGDKVYLMGNGYAPTLTVRNAAGDVVYSDSVPFLPQDSNLTSLGVVKVPDGLPEQVGLVGFFYPTQVALDTGAFTSAFPDLVNPALTFDVYAGDLGIDDGTPRSVYVLNTSELTKLTGRGTDVESIELAPGQTADLPNGWGTITFEDATPAGADREEVGYTEAVKRFASLQVHRDVAAPWVLLFAITALAGLLVALFVPRRRLWVKATPEGATVRVEYAGLARGEDPTLAAAVDQLAERHVVALLQRQPRDPATNDAGEPPNTPA